MRRYTDRSSGLEPTISLSGADPVAPSHDKDRLANTLRAALSRHELQTSIIDRLAIISETDPHGIITHVNDNFCRISGYTRDELIGKTHALLSSGLHPKGFWKSMYATMAKGEVWQAEVRNRAKDGSYYWVQSANAAMRDTQGKLRGYMSLRLDVTESKALETELAERSLQLDAVLKHIPIGISMFDPEQRLVVCNERYREMYGLSAGLTKRGTRLAELMEHQTRAASVTTTHSHTADVMGSYLGKIAKCEPFTYTHFLDDGRCFRVSTGPMPDGGWVDAHEDITHQFSLEKRISHLALHDGLTDLANRTLFNERLEEALAKDPKDSVAVLCLDLDHFKNVNDSFGHAVGDALLQAVATRLRSCVRRTDIVGRMGGDEFTVLQKSKDPCTDAALLAERLIEKISAPYRIEGNEVRIGISVGIAVAALHDKDPKKLLRNADIALYHSKGAGRGTYHFFDGAMSAPHEERAAIKDELLRALTNDEFELHYQPIYDLPEGKIAACEAMLRWRHPERGLLRPSDFLPLAEETGLIVPIGNWVLEHACAEAHSWPAHVRLAINVSLTQLKSPGFAETVLQALTAASFPPHRLEIEVAEGALFEHAATVLPVLQNIRALGARIALDDFGVGCPALSTLGAFPFDKIKVSPSFVSGLSSGNEAARAVVRAVVGLGCDLGIATVADGVDTREQLKEVCEEGMREIQGQILGHPIPAQELCPVFADACCEPVEEAPPVPASAKTKVRAGADG
jgi:diguanylate cyclase (GGDEF)-like protein/PAS domain S-box-containing protein